TTVVVTETATGQERLRVTNQQKRTGASRGPERSRLALARGGRRVGITRPRGGGEGACSRRIRTASGHARALPAAPGGPPVLSPDWRLPRAAALRPPGQELPDPAEWRQFRLWDLTTGKEAVELEDRPSGRRWEKWEFAPGGGALAAWRRPEDDSPGRLV